MSSSNIPEEKDLFGIAIVGMACRFPDARNVNEFWHNLKNGVESIRPFTTEELQASGVDEKTLQNPDFVNAGTVMPDSDAFDASFFGINAREAEIMDPQHRVFLETAWEALESAGYSPERYQGAIGVFGGVGQNAYFQKNLITRPDLLQTMGSYPIMLASEKEYAVTRVSFKLNLKGPSLSVNTACSTSAVAIHLACQSLLSGECDMALAGGAKVGVPLMGGYLYEEGGIRSPDGHCHPFDADARGTVVGNGAGIIVLKRLSDAVRDHDTIHAVIKGSAINNDGSQKVGFTAPSIQGQSLAIEDALTLADVHPDSIGYVETHGTGTSLGDPIEIAALTQAFCKSTGRSGFCAIGSVKSNIGHLDAAAGVAGLIKVVLMLENKMIPASLNFKHPNPEIDFTNSPFYVNAEIRAWESDQARRRAGVSSFGLGGTNAHILLEEAPEMELSEPTRSQQLLLLSARSEAALTRATKNLAEYLRENSCTNLADVAYTLQVGRRHFNHRRMLVCQDPADALIALESTDQKRVITSVQESTERDVVFLFSGQGSQYVNMGMDLYRDEAVFRQTVDRCVEILQPALGVDLREIIYPKEMALEEAAGRLEQTLFTQPALFTIEYALAALWMSWGIKPRAMVGHSIGEYVAACLAGVFSLDDALHLVAARGKLMQTMPHGSMLAVLLDEKTIQPYLNQDVSVSVADSPSLTIISGEDWAVHNLERELTKAEIECQYLNTSHAFHSKMMEPVLEPFRQEIDKVNLNPPQIPFVSNVTGTWMTLGDATDPDYWAKHLRQPVRLSHCFETLLTESDSVFLEVGPGRTLSAAARRNSVKASKLIVLSSTRHPKESESDLTFILTTLGRLWMANVSIDWTHLYFGGKRRRVNLPTYPFERKRYWIDASKQDFAAAFQVSSSQGVTAMELVTGEAGNGGSNILSADSPKTDVEKSIAEIWHKLLGVEDVGIHDNFFDLGGSSLLATRLLTQISGIFGKKLPLSTIFEAPTIEQQAALLEQPSRPSLSNEQSSLVKIQDGKSRPPFYCLPGNLGNVFIDLGHLNRYLGQDQPFYGFQDGLGNPSRVEVLATNYVRDLRRVQPHGPYYLAGICLGSVVAFEMAQQLIRRGEHVPFLAFVEPAAMSLPGVSSYLDVIEEIWMRFTHVSNYGGTGKAFRLGINEIIMLIRLRLKLISNVWNLKRYKPNQYPDQIHIFMTNESLNKGTGLRWQEYAAGGAVIQEIPGTHRSITGDFERVNEEHMQVLGEKLRAGMDDVLAKKNDQSH